MIKEFMAAFLGISAFANATGAMAATFQMFTDRTAFLAAAGPVETEDLNSVMSDTSFSTAPLQINEITLFATGMPAGLSYVPNVVSSIPFVFPATAIDGTSFIQGTVENQSSTDIIISFDTNIVAFGAQFYGLNNNIAVTSFNVLGESFAAPVTNGQVVRFFGFASDAAPVPLPASAFLLIGAFGGLAALRRRR
jgi:hypothetical protein